MATQYNTCIVCGVKYPRCNVCDHINSFQGWRKVACSHEHYQVFLLLREYQAGRLSKADAKDAYERLGIDVALLPEVQALVDEINDTTVQTQEVEPVAIEQEEVLTEVDTAVAVEAQHAETQSVAAEAVEAEAVEADTIQALYKKRKK